jgi:NitT/TauT family transport system substrate-binding protein
MSAAVGSTAGDPASFLDHFKSKDIAMSFKCVLLAACVAGAALAAGGSARADNRIRVLCPVWSGFAPILVAQDLGYFKRQGLDVSVKFEDDVPTILAALDRGDIEMHMFTIGEFQDRPKGLTGGKIISEIDESLGGDGTVADGSIKTVADLKGKTLVEVPTLPALILLMLDLKKVGLSLKDVKLRSSEAADAVAVFSDKSVSAVASSEPQLSQTIKQNPTRNGHIISSSKEYPGYIADIISVRRNDLQANPEKYVKFLTALYQATAYFETHPREFIKLAAPHYNLSVEDFQKSITGTLVYEDYAAAAKAMGKPGAPGDIYSVFNTIMGLNLESGAAQQRISPEDSIDNSIIAKVDPKDIH